MIILTNCLTEVDDEGGLKVANSLVRRIKLADLSVKVISCGNDAVGSDIHFRSNKLMLNAGLASFLHKSREDVLYIPAYARMLPTAMRIVVLSMYTRRKLQTVLVMRSRIGRLAKLLLKMSRAKIIALSADAWRGYRAIIGEKAIRLRTGVDTNRFVPVDVQQKMKLREKYGIPADKPVVLHVGHLTAGRNLNQLLKLDDSFHVMLVISSFALNVKDDVLHQELLKRDNVTLIERYLPDVQEIYQLADVYFFPVVEAGNCIDVPLSALEAASCGKPVVATDYGELRELMNTPGFYRIDDFEAEHLNILLHRAVDEGVSPRDSVLPYDWDCAVDQLLRQ